MEIKKKIIATAIICLLALLKEDDSYGYQED